MISFKESIVTTEYKCLNAYYTSENMNDKPLLLELQEVNQETSKLYTLGNDGKWTSSEFSKDDLTQALDQENCIRNNIVLANVSNKGNYFCKCGNNHREIHVKQQYNNLPIGSELYEHTLQSTVGKESQKSSFNSHRLMDYSKDVTLPEISVKDTNKIYVYFCDRNKNMPLLVYMDNGSEHGGTWLRKIYGDKTWTEADSGSLSVESPNDSDSKDKIGKLLHEVGKELNIGCEHTVNIPTSVATTTPPHPVPPPLPGAAGSGTGSSGGGSRSPSGDVSNNQPSSQQDAGVPGPQGANPRASGQPGLKEPQDSGVRSPGEGGEGPTGDPGKAQSEDNVGRRDGGQKSSGDSSSVSSTDSESSGSNQTDKETSETGRDGQSGADKTDIQKIVQKAVAFITNHPTEIGGGVGATGGLIGLAIWKGPAIFSKILAIFITAV
ncbi:hypothetical protein BEWA_044550 [Theileria equi strain WA]|uniref:Uncharacterized protein n=1 Tax=Theileria equi strain WA TaxID=1537102 RepID=L1LBG3_THEEQ|nr:hypothetical protein BEWA_044550 [Theileria equi strain WA]EKX72614.1 hypothetical protein BEWA_044550 [Theileria equi strain WA]|eukprot:XP_004832066.1 hypothetical protein BEWA_044550 [Theileria equi strain WA]